ncbi:centriolar coiled-coil protein of 110 kDa isoform X2 [Hemicordylus capensis]|uniref:centriolar coiled-coil protein of 110 kDa isoform X2 n=1 Tax=Hemicordylus capensis TaxID=884348 RepID=UPI0023023EC9|nr:centriolar coiled-coil protein of 110 kDa isoform X2 [Hemicordylus capensis]
MQCIYVFIYRLFFPCKPPWPLLRKSGLSVSVLGGGSRGWGCNSDPQQRPRRPRDALSAIRRTTGKTAETKPKRIKMEDYEKFCEKQLARIQGESRQRGTSLPAPPKSRSCIQFNGVPVLSPVLSLAREKELQQDRQKALDLERASQNSRKRILLNRVQEILENVQMKKLSSPSEQDVPPGLESKVCTGFVTAASGVLPSCPALRGPAEPPKALEVKPAGPHGAVPSGSSLQGAKAGALPPQEDAGPGDGACAEGVCPGPSHTFPAKEDGSAVVLAAAEGPDPYVMSLQNLMKKSREYIQREQNRRSLRSSSRRSLSESHSDKENDAVKMSDSGKERGGKLANRGSLGVAAEKPSLTKSSTSLQSASVPKSSMHVAASPSFSKVDIPMRAGTPPVLDSDSDEDFRSSSLFDHDSSILRSLTGSYSKLPSPEPSMSPKMHRRRPRPSSMGHIVINNPVNAYELSPKEKERMVDLIPRDAGDKKAAASDHPVPKLTAGFAPAGSSQVHSFHRSSSDICDGLVVGKLSQACQHPVGQPESRGLPARGEGESALGGRPEPPAAVCSAPPQTAAGIGGAKPVCLLDKARPTGLNRSYDVESPSPLLTQTQHSQPTDPPSEQALEGGFEELRRRLELDPESLQKENLPSVVAAGAGEPGKQWPHEQRGPVRAALAMSNETPGPAGSEAALKQKMLAFEALRRRLEDQHAQELSLLIAEQEREQERLQKEIEAQERRLKGEEAAAAEAEIPPITISSGVELEWRKISDTCLLGSMLTEVETHSDCPGFAHATGPALTAESPFYLWEPPASGKSTATSRSVNRSKMRWSQVYSPEMKRKLDKISALAKGFLTRRLLQTEKLKHLSQTVKDTMEFIKNFQSEAPLKRGTVSAQDADLQERVVAQLRAALFDIHDIFFEMEVPERMSLLRHDREVRRERMLRQLDKAKTLRERVALSTATQKSLDRKKYMKAAEMGMLNKRTMVRQKTQENRVLQPNQGQNAPVIQRLLSRQGTPKTSVKGAEQNRKKPSESRVSNKALSGASAGRIQRKKLNVVTT